MLKILNFGEFLKKTKACGHKVLPDRSLLIGQKLMKNAKIENATFLLERNRIKIRVKIVKFKCDILDDFQTLCTI